MNDQIARINTIKAKIKCIEHIIKERDWRAAGLTVAVKVGALSEEYTYDVVTELGIASQDEGYNILNAVRQGLELSLAYNMGALRREHEELQRFLEAEK